MTLNIIKSYEFSYYIRMSILLSLINTRADYENTTSNKINRSRC